jgi:hypothetical protein
MKTYWLILLSLLSLGPQLAAVSSGAQAWGHAFIDANGNRQLDAGETLLEGIRVSNGRDIVMTDAAGRYAIAVSPGDTLFVIKPRGLRPPLDADNAPQFHYLHEPDGTPDDGFIFKGIAPTGPLPASIDFPLYQTVEQSPFRVALVADPQFYISEELSHYGRTVLAELREGKIDFAFALGDLVGDNLELLAPFKAINELAGFPWYYVAGNHDLNFMAESDRHADATFRRVFGPPSYAFQYGPVHFIVLRTVHWDGFAGFRRDGWPQRGGYSNRLSDAHLTFVGNYLATVSAEERVVICTHIPLVYPDPKWNPEQLEKLFTLLSGHPHTVSFSGHTHGNMNLFAGAELGYAPDDGSLHHHHVLGTASGSWYRGLPDELGVPQALMADGTPKGYAIATFDGNAYAVRYRSVGRPDSHQIRITAPDAIPAGEVAGMEVWANAFNGSSRSVVEMRIGADRGWQPMESVIAPDPGYQALLELHSRYEGPGRPLPDPMPCTHLWRATVDGALKPGMHMIEVRSRDQFGQTDHASRPVWVLADPDQLDRIERTSTRFPREQSASGNR